MYFHIFETQLVYIHVVLPVAIIILMTIPKEIMFKSLFLSRVAEFIYIEGDCWNYLQIKCIIPAEDTLFYSLLQDLCLIINYL